MRAAKAGSKIEGKNKVCREIVKDTNTLRDMERNYGDKTEFYVLEIACIECGFERFK